MVTGDGLGLYSRTSSDVDFRGSVWPMVKRKVLEHIFLKYISEFAVNGAVGSHNLIGGCMYLILLIRDKIISRIPLPRRYLLLNP